MITLASPGTTGDVVRQVRSRHQPRTTSRATRRRPTAVMINAYRWAQGATTYGHDKMFAYRQMLINHEVGHRLGHDHATCPGRARSPR